MNIAFFISSHGFGHAARACAVMQKLWNALEVNIFIFTTTPEWFFRNSLNFPFIYIYEKTDVGLIQSSPFEEDLDKTIIALNQFYPIKKERLENLKRFLGKENISLIFSDISPLGIVLGEEIGIPTVLIENFTWDWIYEYYVEQNPKFVRYIDYLKKINQLVSVHISCEPYCINYSEAIKVSPIFREPKINAHSIRRQLNIGDDKDLVLITMGGIPIENTIHVNPKKFSNSIFLFPVNSYHDIESNGNIIYLPHNHGYFHPDLVNACDLVVGKLGYSTIAEAYSMDKPFLFIGRKNFRESVVLQRFVQENMISEMIDLDTIFSDESLSRMKSLIKDNKNKKVQTNGADEVVKIIIDKFFD